MYNFLEDHFQLNLFISLFNYGCIYLCPHPVKNKLVDDNNFAALININALEGLMVLSMFFFIACKGLVYYKQQFCIKIYGL